MRFISSNGDYVDYRANYETLTRGPDQIAGRIIGLSFMLGSTSLTDNQPMAVAVIYNSCNCPIARFLENAPPNDMTITAVSDEDQTQTIAFQNNNIASGFGQDCGTYSVRFDQDYSYLELSSSGSNFDPQGRPYTDTITLKKQSASDFGVKTIKLIIE